MRVTILLAMVTCLTACNESSEPDDPDPPTVVDLGVPGIFDCVWPVAPGEPANGYPYPDAAERTCAFYRGAAWLSVDGMRVCRIGNDEFECSAY